MIPIVIEMWRDRWKILVVYALTIFLAMGCATRFQKDESIALDKSGIKSQFEEIIGKQIAIGKSKYQVITVFSDVIILRLVPDSITSLKAEYTFGLPISSITGMIFVGNDLRMVSIVDASLLPR